MKQHDQKPDHSGHGGNAGKAGTDGYHLRFMIAVVERMNVQPTVIEIKAEPEDESHWVRQPPFDTAA